MVENVLAADPSPHPPTLGGVNRSKFHFFRTWSLCLSNLRESRFQQHGTKYFACRPLPPDPSQPWGWGQMVKIQLFQNMVILHIKKRIPNVASWYQIICLQSPPPPPPPGDRVNRSKFNFPEHGHVAYQIKENHECSNIVANNLSAPPSPPLGRSH